MAPISCLKILFLLQLWAFPLLLMAVPLPPPSFASPFCLDSPPFSVPYPPVYVTAQRDIFLSRRHEQHVAGV